jgi:hypothetical protein
MPGTARGKRGRGESVPTQNAVTAEEKRYGLHHRLRGKEVRSPSPPPERRNSRGKEVRSPSPPISAGKEVSSPLQQTSPSPTPPLSCASESDKTRPGGALFKTANKASNRADGAPMIPCVLRLQDVETTLHPIRKDVRSPGKCPILPHPSDKYTDWLTPGFDLAI